MKILGIDPGTGKENFGWAILDKTGLLDSGVIKIPINLSFPRKLLHLAERVASLIEDNNIELMAVESFFNFGRSKGATRISELRGVLQYVSALYNIPFADVAPLTVKKMVTGSGKASKAEVLTAVLDLFTFESDDTPTNNHEIDAIAIAHTALKNVKKVRT